MGTEDDFYAWTGPRPVVEVLGRRLQSPAFHHRVDSFQSVHLAEHDAVAAALPTDELHPVQWFDGRAAVLVWAVRHHEVTAARRHRRRGRADGPVGAVRRGGRERPRHPPARTPRPADAAAVDAGGGRLRAAPAGDDRGGRRGRPRRSSASPSSWRTWTSSRSPASAGSPSRRRGATSCGSTCARGGRSSRTTATSSPTRSAGTELMETTFRSPGARPAGARAPQRPAAAGRPPGRGGAGTAGHRPGAAADHEPRRPAAHPAVEPPGRLGPSLPGLPRCRAVTGPADGRLPGHRSAGARRCASWPGCCRSGLRGVAAIGRCGRDAARRSVSRRTRSSPPRGRWPRPSGGPGCPGTVSGRSTGALRVTVTARAAASTRATTTMSP